MGRIPIRLLLLMFMVCRLGAGASQKPPTETETKPKDRPAEVPKAEQSVTQHKITIGGAAIDYRATAGTLFVRDSNDVPYASMGYVAYEQNGVADPSRRPVTFSYNGGPGSSSIWLHMGTLGPKRIITSAATHG